jgi:small-conductance mechanosensitive channel
MDALKRFWYTLSGEYGHFGRAALILLGGLIVSRLVKRLVQTPALRASQLLILRRFASGITLIVAIGWALSELGLNLGYLLGAAGVLTLAVGFASQTSVSNLISGLFLMSEQPFVVGDTIEVGGKLGEVRAIDLLSVKLRTPDNLLVRIPNEAMLKSNVTNLTHFPIRRLEMPIGVAYDSDFDRVRDVLLEVVAGIPECLVEPAPLVRFQGFGDSALLLDVAVWVPTAKMLEMRTRIPVAVKAALDAAGIVIPFPQRTLYVHSLERDRVPSRLTASE